MGVQILVVSLGSDATSDTSKTAVAGRLKGKELLDAPADKGAFEVQSKPGQPEIKLDAAGNELVETGTSTIPHFPRTVLLPSTRPDPSSQPTGAGSDADEEYSLLGLGIRTVSFLGIQVYVLGMYVRTSDLETLQAAFVKHINEQGSSLIPSEKAVLRRTLLDKEQGLAVWDKVLRAHGARTAVRIVPTRGTDFAHLRDGWVRGITARTQDAARAGETDYDDEAFGEAVKQFKALFGGRGKAPKGSTMYLTRDERGALGVLFEPLKREDGQPARMESLGDVSDERISRQVWLGYLGGKSVSSEGAMRSIVDGVMELVERPVGTVGTRVS